ncbi:hypothetical protein ACTFIZ_003630 [Dictyostelium cf. discoideum]
MVGLPSPPLLSTSPHIIFTNFNNFKNLINSNYITITFSKCYITNCNFDFSANNNGNNNNNGNKNKNKIIISNLEKKYCTSKEITCNSGVFTWRGYQCSYVLVRQLKQNEDWQM